MAELKKVQSADVLCQSKVEQDSEKVFTLALVPPVVLIVLYVGLLQVMAKGLEEEAYTEPYSDPIKRVWWSGPIFFSVAYLLMVYFGPKLMANRKEFQIKPFILYHEYLDYVMMYLF